MWQCRLCRVLQFGTNTVMNKKYWEIFAKGPFKQVVSTLLQNLQQQALSTRRRSSSKTVYLLWQCRCQNCLTPVPQFPVQVPMTRPRLYSVFTLVTSHLGYYYRRLQPSPSMHDPQHNLHPAPAQTVLASVAWVNPSSVSSVCSGDREYVLHYLMLLLVWRSITQHSTLEYRDKRGRLVADRIHRLTIV